jgi:hypothetical protein
VEVKFGDEKMEFERTVCKSCLSLVTENLEPFHLPESWQIAVIRAEEDRIIIECADGADYFWFPEKARPPLKQDQDRLREAAS